MSSKAKKDTKAASRKKDPKNTKATGKSAAKTAAKGKDTKAKGKAASNKVNSRKTDPKATGKGGKKGADSGKGKKGGKKAPKQEKSSGAVTTQENKEEEYKTELKVDIGPPVELPQTKDFETDVPSIKEFALKEDDIVDEVKTQFESFEKLLKQAKKACLSNARGLVAKVNEDTAPVCIDIEGMKRLINAIGTPSAAAEYNVMKQRIKCIDKAKELMAYESKHASVSKKLEATSKTAIQAEINESKKVLDEAEPILQASRDALTKISKSSLDEIRALPKPHPLLVKTVTACAIMVGKPESELNGWPNVKKLLKTTFINELIKFEARNITQEIRTTLETNYLAADNDDIPDNEKLTYENVNKANAVAGNLVKWVEAQLKYNEFIPKVEPMQAKLKELEVKLLSIEGITKKYEDALAELAKRIETSKQELREEGKIFDKFNAACKQSLTA